MDAVIRNCEFRFKCPKTWDALEVTTNAQQRFCDDCHRTVHYCKTPEQLQQAIVANWCVAVELRPPEALTPRLFVGEPSDPGYFPGRKV